MKPTIIISSAIGLLAFGFILSQSETLPNSIPIPTNTITTQRVHMASPPSALEAPVMDGMTGAGKPAPTNALAILPTFADGVLIAVAVLRSNPGFATLLTPQEQVALCARVWQQQKSAQNK